MGNEMRQPRRSMSAFTSASASGTASRGSAYSISRNRTVRLVTKTRGDGSVKSRLPVSRWASRLNGGTIGGHHRPSRADAAVDAVGEQLVVAASGRPRQRRALRASSGSRVFVFVSAVSVCGNQ